MSDKLNTDTHTPELNLQKMERMLDTVKETVRQWLSEQQCRNHAVFVFEDDGSLRLDFPALVMSDEVGENVRALDGLTMRVTASEGLPDTWSLHFSPAAPRGEVTCKCP